MKTTRLLTLIGFAAATIALVWQARTIIELRAEVTGLRKDLRIVLAGAPDDPSVVSSEAEQAWREQLELIKLRHQVRELKEGMVESHARERRAAMENVMRLIVPAPAASGPWTFRSEWRGMEAQATNQYAQAMQALASATNDYARFLTLARAAKMSLVVGRTEDARQFATDMMVLDDSYSRGVSEKANGDVVHDANWVLGRIAVEEGRLEEAKQRLLAAGKSSGSPVLCSFGPNMSLANDLLAKGEQEAVLQYLELCRKFWSSGGGKLDEWVKDIQAGRIPDFGANLIY